MSESILDLTPPKADERVKYGPEALHFIDLRFPKTTKPWPVVINIHGGFWRAQYDLAHAGHLCAALTDAGIATCNIEYRRVGNPGGGWPGTFEDIRNAYAYIRQRAGELGFDASRMAVMGHSAGGHLAICLAGHEPTVTRAISLAGVLDLQRAYDLHLSNDAVVEFLGGTPRQVPDHYREAGPLNLKVAARQLIVTGDADEIVPPDFSRHYVSRKKAAEAVELLEVPKAGHFDMIDPRTEAFKPILAKTSALLN